MMDEKNTQINALQDVLRNYQFSDYKRRESNKMKSMSEIRTSRIEYKRDHSLLPSETLYSSRNQLHSSRMGTYHSCK